MSERPPTPLPDPYSYGVWREQQIRLNKRTMFIDRILTLLLGARKHKRKFELPPTYAELAAQYKQQYESCYSKPYKPPRKTPHRM